jgi:ActR/RegA family two-component response regulator
VNKLTKEQQIRVVACLVERNSLHATARMTGVHRKTIQNLLVELAVFTFRYL